MAIKGIDANKMIKVLIVGLVFLFLITSIINFNAINSDDPNAKVFKEDVDYEALAPDVFQMLLAGMAVWLAWTLTLGFSGRLDRKKLVSLVVLGVILYFVYNKVLVGLIPELPPIEFAAYQLQAIMGP